MHLQELAHQAATSSIMAAAPNQLIRDVLTQIYQAAVASGIPWLKIMQAFATAAAGGFTPASITAAIAILFGTNVPPQLKAHAVAP